MQKNARSKEKAAREKYLRADPFRSRRFDDIAEKECSEETENCGLNSNSIDFGDERENEDFTGISTALNFNEDEMEVYEDESKCKEPNQLRKRDKKKTNKAIDMHEKRKRSKGKARSRRAGLASIEFKNLGMEENGNWDREIWNLAVESRGTGNCRTEGSNLAKTESSFEKSTGLRSSEIEMIETENVGMEASRIRNPGLHSNGSGNSGMRNLAKLSCGEDECRENEWELQVEAEAKVPRKASRNHVVSGIDIEKITVEHVEYENERFEDNRHTDLDLEDHFPGAVGIRVKQTMDEDESDYNRINNIDIVDREIKADVSSENGPNQKRVSFKDAEQQSTETKSKMRRFGCFPAKKCCVQKKRKDEHVIDRYSRALFPSTFIIFNGIYAAFCIWEYGLTES